MPPRADLGITSAVGGKADIDTISHNGPMPRRYDRAPHARRSRSRRPRTRTAPDPRHRSPAHRPQFRIATPDADWWITITLTDTPKGRQRRLALVSDFMTWKLSSGLILASELHEPDTVLSLGLRHDAYAP